MFLSRDSLGVYILKIPQKEGHFILIGALKNSLLFSVKVSENSAKNFMIRNNVQSFGVSVDFNKGEITLPAFKV